MKLKNNAIPDQQDSLNQSSKKLTFTWERLIPKQIADDAASKKILDLHLQRYETATRYVQAKKVLDIACGAGYGSQMLAVAGASNLAERIYLNFWIKQGFQ